MMVTFSYYAQEQAKRLSPQERQQLQAVLNLPTPNGETTKLVEADKFVSRFGRNKRAVWTKREDGNIVVLTVVSKEG